MSDFMQEEQWRCLTCLARFRFGALRMKPGSPYIHCPHCSSANIHPADGRAHDLPEYHGEKGAAPMSGPLYPATTLVSHGPCRSLADYLAELVERLDALPLDDRRRGDFARRIRDVEIEIDARSEC